MSDSGTKRSRKAKLLPRECMEMDDENYLQLQAKRRDNKKSTINNDTTNFQTDDFEALIDETRRKRNTRQFSVTVAVEELNENNTDVTATQEDLKKETIEVETSKPEQFTLERDDIIKTTDSIYYNPVNDAEKLLAIEVKNTMGRFSTDDTDLMNDKLQSVLGSWQIWYKMHLTNHKNHILNRPLSYKCYICKQAWWHLSPFRDHIKNHTVPFNLHLEKYSYCEMNIIAFDTDYDLYIENFPVNENCPICGKHFDVHNSIPNLDAPYSCNVKDCKSIFPTCMDLQNHEYEHILNTFGVEKCCIVCKDIKFTNDELYEEHMKLRHEVRSDWVSTIYLYMTKCMQCGVQYINSNYCYSKLHVCLRLGLVKQCKRCFKKFPNKNELRDHTKRSTKAFKCSVCGVVDKKCMEVDHLLLHTDKFIKVIKCVLCKKFVIFFNDDAAMLHLKTEHKNAWHIITAFKTNHPNNYMDVNLIPRKCIPHLLVTVGSSSTNEATGSRSIPSHIEAVVQENWIIAVKEEPVDPSLNAQTLEINAPQLAINAPQLEINVPTLEMHAPTLEINAPQLAINAPQLEINVPTLEINAQTLEINAPHLEIKQEVVDDFYNNTENEDDDNQMIIKQEIDIDENFVHNDNQEYKFVNDTSTLYGETVNANDITVKQEEESEYEDDIIILDENYINNYKLTHAVIEKTEIEDAQHEFQNDETDNFETQDFENSETDDLENDINENEDSDEYVPKNERKKRKKSVIYKCKKCNFEGAHREYKIHKLMKCDDALETVTIKIEANEDSDENFLTEETLKQEPNSYQCRKCGFQGLYSELVEHKNTNCDTIYHEEGIYSCTKCFQTYNTLNNYLNHFTTHGFQRNICPVCYKHYSTDERLISHFYGHIQGKIIVKCATKIPNFKKRSNIVYTCSDCQEIVEKNDVFQHWESHFVITDNEELKKRPLNVKKIVEIKSISDQESLKSVIDQLLDSTSTDLTCIICRKRSNKKQDFKIHLIEHLYRHACKVNKNATLTCQICNKKFKDILYKKHIGNHVGITYECEHCRKKFSNSTNLSKHKKLHEINELITEKEIKEEMNQSSDDSIHEREDLIHERSSEDEYIPQGMKTKIEQKIYKCKKCAFEAHRKEFKKHKMLHCREVYYHKGDYSCSKCGIIYESFSHYAKHFTKHEFELNTCPVCQMKCNVDLKLLQHLYEHVKINYEVKKINKIKRKYDKTPKFEFKCISCEQKVEKFDLFPHFEIHLSQNLVEIKNDGVRYNVLKEYSNAAFASAMYVSILESAKIDQSDDEEQDYERRFMCKGSSKTRTPMIYRCHKCGFEGLHSAFSVHRLSKCRLTYYNEGIFNCTKCFKEFRTFQNYVRHISEHGFQKNTCPVCFKQYNSIVQLIPHIYQHIQSKFVAVNVFKIKNMKEKRQFVYNCNYCQERVEKSDFFEHWESHLSLVPYVRSENVIEGVEITRIKSNLSENLLKSVIAQLQSTTIPETGCMICERRFARKHDLKRHLVEHLYRDACAHETDHNGFQCQICLKMYAKPFAYKKHMRDHANMPVYECEQCDKSFSDSSNFAKHKKVHNINAFTCDVCGKKFQQKVSIEKHMAYHQQHEPITCKICDKTFHFPSLYKKHYKMLHEKEKHTFGCRVCLDRFDSLKEKWEHMWHKHNMRLNVADCNFCNKKFRRLLDLKQHMKFAHRDKVQIWEDSVRKERKQFKNKTKPKILQPVLYVQQDSPEETLVIVE